MSETRIRGKAEGETPEERVRAWLRAERNVGENMTWVGKDYPLSQLKTDVGALLMRVPGPNVREWHRTAPDSIAIRFSDDITDEQVEAFPKALVATWISMDEGKAGGDRTVEADIELGPDGNWRIKALDEQGIKDHGLFALSGTGSADMLDAELSAKIVRGLKDISNSPWHEDATRKADELLDLIPFDPDDPGYRARAAAVDRAPKRLMQPRCGHCLRVVESADTRPRCPFCESVLVEQPKESSP